MACGCTYMYIHILFKLIVMEHVSLPLSFSLSLMLYLFFLSLPPSFPLFLSLLPSFLGLPVSLSLSHATHTDTFLYLVTCHFYIFTQMQYCLSLYVCVWPKLSGPFVRSTLCHNRHGYGKLGDLESRRTRTHPHNDNTFQVSCC